MWEWFLGTYEWTSVAILMLSAVLIGINKTGVPGLGMLPVLLLASCFPARESTGIQLLLLGTADIMAVLYYRRHADWTIVMRLLPWALVGIALGALCMMKIRDEWMRPVLAWIILFMVAIGFLARGIRNADKVPKHWVFSAFFGLMAGFTTQVANAAGPVMSIYLLSMRLPKNAYIGSAAWYFLILNWIKIPIFIFEGRITASAFRADLAVLPMLGVGAALGIVVLSKLPQKRFEQIIQILIVAAALKMLIFG